jgi:hypothetical protein
VTNDSAPSSIHRPAPRRSAGGRWVLLPLVEPCTTLHGCCTWTAPVVESLSGKIQWCFPGPGCRKLQTQRTKDHGAATSPAAYRGVRGGDPSPGAARACGQRAGLLPQLGGEGGPPGLPGLAIPTHVPLKLRGIQSPMGVTYRREHLVDLGHHPRRGGQPGGAAPAAPLAPGESVIKGQYS